MMAARVVPLGCLSNVRTRSCLVPARAGLVPAGLAFGPLDVVALLLPPAGLRCLEIVLRDIVGSFPCRDGHGAVTPEAPPWQHGRRGRIPGEARQEQPQ